MKNILLSAGLILLAGCTQFIKATGQYGVVTSVSTHQFGLFVTTATSANPYPEVVLGSQTTTVTFEPTSTNAILSTPNFAETIDDRAQGWNPFNYSGFYGIGTGQEATYEAAINATNTASSVSSQPQNPK